MELVSDSAKFGNVKIPTPYRVDLLPDATLTVIFHCPFCFGKMIKHFASVKKLKILNGRSVLVLDDYQMVRADSDLTKNETVLVFERREKYIYWFDKGKKVKVQLYG